MARLDSNLRIGVALGGGGAAALAEIGALEVFREAGFEVSSVAGTSAGAVVGAAFAAGRLDEMRDALSAMTRRRALWLFDPRWPRSGLFVGKSTMEFLRPFVGERIEDLPLPFGAVATDLETGEDVVLGSGSVIDALRASIAIPGLFAPCRIDGRWLVDGALVNPIPVSVTRTLGADFVIAINVLPVGDRTHGAFHAAYRELRDTRAARWLRRLARRSLDEESLLLEQDLSPSENPGAELSLSAVLSQASRIVQARIAAGRLENEAPDYLLTIPLVDATMFDFGGTTKAVARGREIAEQALDEIRTELARSATRLRLRRFGPWWPGQWGAEASSHRGGMRTKSARAAAAVRAPTPESPLLDVVRRAGDATPATTPRPS